jgi:RNA processing factor Prp31
MFKKFIPTRNGIIMKFYSQEINRFKYYESKEKKNDFSTKFENRYKTKLPKNLKELESKCEKVINEEDYKEMKKVISQINQTKIVNPEDRKCFQVLIIKMIQMLMKLDDKVLILNLFHEFEKKKNVSHWYIFNQ